MRADHVLNDPNYEVPAVPRDVSPGGIDWLRATVARFSTGETHHRRRALAVDLLDAVSPSDLRARAHDLAASGAPVPPVIVLAEAVGVPAAPEAVASIAAAYHPHLPAGEAQDAAVATLVSACGGVPDERTAALIGLLVQAHAATSALIASARGRSEDPDIAVSLALADSPPVVSTRRVHAGQTVEVDLRALPFGAGPHACPGRAHAIAIACGTLAGEAAR